MSTLRISVLLLVFLAISAISSVGRDYVVDGSEGCRAIGGEWFPNACLVHRLVVQAGSTLTVAPGVYFSSDGPIYNYGRVDIAGTFTPYGPVYNRGTFLFGQLFNGAPVLNYGTMVGRGWIHPHESFENYGVFENHGYFETCSSWLYNRGYLHNSGGIANWSGMMVNEGIIVNDDYFHNPSGPYYRFDNIGAFENNGVFENGGVVWCACGGAWYGTGSIDGFPVEFEACESGNAVDRLNAAVIQLGPQAAGYLSKGQVIRLTSLAAEAGKRLASGRPDDASALLRLFVQEVGGLAGEGALPRYMADALIARANRIHGQQ
jgi:hypothetical protein